MRILLQEFNLKTKLGPTQGNIDLLAIGGVRSTRGTVILKKVISLEKLC